MRSQTIGRALGIGVRVAGRIVERQLMGSSQPVASAPAQPVVNTGIPIQAARHSSVQAAARSTVRNSGSVARGIGGFLRPFRRVGSIVWLEVTGVFFLLPVIAFTPNLWRMRASWAHGPDHRMFLVTAGVIAVFLYLGVSSFWRARRK